MDLQGHANPRAALVSELTNLHGGLQRAEGLKRQHLEIVRRYRPLMPLPKKWGLLAPILSSVGLVIAAFTFASPVTEVVFNIVLDPFISIEWAKANVETALIITIATPVALSVGLALLVTELRNKVLLPWQHSRAIRFNQEREAHNKAVSTEEWTIRGQLAQVENDLAQSGAWYPQSYLHEDAVAFCAHAVKNHRANDITSAINLYETELRHAELVAEQQRTQAYVALASFENDANARATNEGTRQEGARTRANNNANAARIAEESRKPRTVHVKRRW